MFDLLRTRYPAVLALLAQMLALLGTALLLMLLKQLTGWRLPLWQAAVLQGGLAAALGHLGNASHPEVQAAIAQVFADAKAAGKPSGILAPVEADARRYLAMGATFVGVGSDLGAFRNATQALCDRYRD